MGAFVISKKHNDEYKFVYTSRKGKIVFTSKSYELKMYCEEDIELIKANAQKAQCLKFKASNGTFFYKLMIGEKNTPRVENSQQNCVLQKELQK